MRLPKLLQRGVIPILPLLGMLILTIGIGVSISLSRETTSTNISAQTRSDSPTLSQTSATDCSKWYRRIIQFAVPCYVTTPVTIHEPLETVPNTGAEEATNSPKFSDYLDQPDAP